MLFVAGAIILLGFAVGVVQSAIRSYRDHPHRNFFLSVTNVLPHAFLLFLVALLLYVVVREFLRT